MGEVAHYCEVTPQHLDPAMVLADPRWQMVRNRAKAVHSAGISAVCSGNESTACCFRPSAVVGLGPKGPKKDLIDAVVAMKRRNPGWGCLRIAQQIELASRSTRIGLSTPCTSRFVPPFLHRLAASLACRNSHCSSLRFRSHFMPLRLRLTFLSPTKRRFARQSRRNYPAYFNSKQVTRKTRSMI